ncbi:MAG: NAD(P)-dependent alcohol dehydrogenase [Caldilinea sp. CFX5]|nr:NAD(P)-dependent alcohol dehydrogenase [Caldilinea sp. CFX5]
MKAMVWTNYGPPEMLQLQEVAKPTPKDNELLIKVHAATVTLADCELRRLKVAGWLWLPLRLYMGLLKPTRVTILGQELAGEVAAVGKTVTRFKPGDPVFGPTMLRLGAYAEYICLPEKNLVRKPADLSYEEAATIPTGGVNGWHFLNVAQVQPGESVLINGAGGSIGTYAVQIAKAQGATVTAIDSGEKLPMLRSIGADHVIDYRQEDFTKSSQRYDVIIDVVGKSPFARSVKALKPNGRYILGNPSFLSLLRARWTPLPAGKKATFAVAGYQAEDYAALQALMTAGKLKPVMDRRYPLAQLAEAHRYVEEGHKKGNVIILVENA